MADSPEVSDFIEVVSSSSCRVRRLNQEAGGGHRRKERADAENSQVEHVLVLHEELLLVPVACRDP